MDTSGPAELVPAAFTVPLRCFCALDEVLTKGIHEVSCPNTRIAVRADVFEMQIVDVGTEQ